MLTEFDGEGNNEQLLLLHLSDIHFREPYCLNSETDQDNSVRTALLNDIREMVDRLGVIDAIIISGDIAFKGHSDEYKVATEWLLEVTNIAGCPPTSIYTVPGNHDVDRGTANSRVVLGVRELIQKKEAGPHRDKELHDTILDQSGLELFKPMAEYNRFAAPFECAIDAEQPFWTKDLPIAPGWKLKMHGLTTTLFSGPGNDVKGSLYLGALQRAFAPDDGIIRLATMHHPPDWLGDADELDDALWEHCALHLFGHKHRQRYLPSDNSVRFAAGAVNPDRGEGNWEPGYNLIRLQVNSETTQHVLHVESYLRVWQTAPDLFVGKTNGDGNDVFKHQILLRRNPSPISENFNKQNTQTGLQPEEKANIEDAEKLAVVTNENDSNQMHQRDIAFHFWELTASDRRKVMQTLNLLEADDDKLPEPQRYRRAFKRAQERGMFSDIEQAIKEVMRN
ncbi:MAG: metallophosphoesterase [Woeseiaceae bacterium]